MQRKTIQEVSNGEDIMIFEYYLIKFLIKCMLFTKIKIIK